MEITLLFVGLALVCSALVAMHDAIEKYGPRLFTAAKRRLARKPLFSRRLIPSRIPFLTQEPVRDRR